MKTSNIKKNSYKHVVAILNKYYGYGKNKHYFKTKNDLNTEAKTIWKELKRTQKEAKILKDKELKKLGKVTIKNVKNIITKPTPKYKLLPLPEKWDKIRLYYELEDLIYDIAKRFPKGYVITSPQILGKDKNGNDIKLYCSNLYEYETTFQPFVVWLNENINDERNNYFYVKLVLVDKKINRDGEQRLLLKCCDIDGKDAYYGYIPPNTEQVIKKGKSAEQMIKEQREKKEIKETETETQKPQPQQKDVDISKYEIEQKEQTKRYEIEQKEKTNREMIASLERLLEKGKITFEQYMSGLEKLK